MERACSTTHQKPTNAPVPTYAQVVAAVNAAAGETDPIITAAGGLPGEVVKGWRVKAPNTFDCEFGFSCMGYEIAAGWGYAMANAGPADGGTPIVMVGDGTYMMMNSDIYSSVLTGHKMIVVVCDNGGYARHQPPAERQGHARLQQPHPRLPGANREPFPVDFVKHAEVDGRARAPLREPRRPRGGARMGAGHRPHHRDHRSPPTPSPGFRATPTGTSACPRSRARKRARGARKSRIEIRAKQRVGV